MSKAFVEIVRELVRLNQQAAEDEYLDTGEVVALADRAEQLLRQHEDEAQPGTETVSVVSALTIDTSKLMWEEIGPEADPAAYLLTEAIIDGVYHHLEARQVQDENDTQQIVCMDIAEGTDQLREGFGVEGSFQTVLIGEREYALFLSPYSC